MIKEAEFMAFIQDMDQQFSGWDFSRITASGRMQSHALPWSLGSMVIPLMRNAATMLDMGTGGGEFLSSLQPLPETVYATEGYKPNVPIAQQKLEPLGVKVVYFEEDSSLPLKDHFFDLIINQHESYSVAEIKRILNDHGVFVTQQSGGTDCYGINEWFGVPLNEEFAHWNLGTAVQELQDHGLNVTFSREDFSPQRFYDIGALIYYLQAIPWQIPDFTVERHLEPLYQVHQVIRTKGYFEVQQHRFIIIAEA
ncbi:methyltransferase domain-containing protein [Paenibacillus sp. 2KB_20]|uniref:methyltransferase domain-containing protein n=1 Tax=Paenibacillus sp. 2KB_20 TaxID=3232977 RepID=UPI003F977E63